MNTEIVEFTFLCLTELPEYERELKHNGCSVAPKFTERLFLERCAKHFNIHGEFNIDMNVVSEPMGKIKFAEYWIKEGFYKKLLLKIHPDKSQKYSNNQGVINYLKSINEYITRYFNQNKIHYKLIIIDN